MRINYIFAAAAALGSFVSTARAQVAIRGETVYTMAGEPIRDGIVIIRNGKIDEVGAASAVRVPPDFTILRAAVVVPGLVDAHTCVGLTGYLNQPHDQEQIERSAPIQPELRAIDAYNPEERLIEWIRGFGVTTIHTGHGPGALISGQTMIAKTVGKTVDEAVMVSEAMVAATLGDGAQNDKSPGTRAKAVAMLREELIKTQAYKKKLAVADETKRPERNLRMETLSKVLDGAMPLLVTAQRHTDMSAALRLADEFHIKLVLDGAADAPMLIESLQRARVSIIIHPAMQRAGGETDNLTFESAAKLRDAGIPFAFQSGFEGYVPKTRVVLFEAAVAAAHGLGRDAALRALTIDAARLLGIDKRVGSLEKGKDGDVALYDGDPFEYTTHCTGVVIDGKVVADKPR
ncbi:MAG: amidohydrolase family protein [Planctomycetes bacterium]|nr:amidohydrolase family protein [Planctomycetota bacterium]